jgi:hypothetical protein
VDGPKPTSITGGGATNGIDMVSRCILTSLAKDDVVTLTFKGDKPYSDAEIQQTGFSGFFYHPTSSIQVDHVTSSYNYITGGVIASNVSLPRMVAMVWLPGGVVSEQNRTRDGVPTRNSANVRPS